MITPIKIQTKKPIYNIYKDNKNWPASTRPVKPSGQY